jgi:nucleotide-binding universal stress UspA family protein
MTRPIVCGVDFSEASRRALVMAAALADRLHRPLIAVTVVDSLLAQAAASLHSDHGLRARVLNELESWARNGRLGSPALTARVEIGEPAEQLLRTASKEQAAMLVMATQGFGPVKRLWLGSTTQRVLRSARVPVLAVPPGALGEENGLSFGRLVCGVDFSDASNDATRVAAELARALSLPLLLIHAIDAPAVPSVLMELAEDVAKRRLTDAGHLLRQAVATLEIGRLSTETQVGDPSAVLVQRANEPGPGALVVLGLGGADPNLRPGTTAFRVLADARAPVLAVPAGATLARGSSRGDR